MVSDRLKELNIVIPDAPKPLAAYVPAVKIGDLVYTSGQLPLENGAIKFIGKVGAEISTEDGQEAARICAINCMSAILSVVPSLEQIEKIVKVTVFINSTPGYTSQPEVANGASQLLLDIFGEKGKHARSAVGVAELPRNAAVEIELIAKISA
ncbi:MAG: RidA family protein [Ignavibacteria bacterium]|nr:RidA family protein [Ignavibacteria bacterium]